jgi:hypothetical protein
MEVTIFTYIGVFTAVAWFFKLIDLVEGKK